MFKYNIHPQKKKNPTDNLLVFMEQKQMLYNDNGNRK